MASISRTACIEANLLQSSGWTQPLALLDSVLLDRKMCGHAVVQPHFHLCRTVSNYLADACKNLSPAAKLECK
eukprot:909327-Amphidinium_carterae.1